MNISKRRVTTAMLPLLTRNVVMAAAISATFAVVNVAFAQNDDDQGSPKSEELQDEIVVVGIKSSLRSALAAKRNADNLVEVIIAEDIGKLPDQNLAEVLENVTGIQITREAGVGTGVQIRGTNANRTEINGVSTSGSGEGRSGIDFDDVSAAIIAAVEVTKAPEAKTIEGSVGGTINLKTIRPLDLQERLGVVRVQGENSSLSDDSSFTPRLSGTFGDNWETADGQEFGYVISGSYAEQDVTAFRPRVDRDNLVTASSGVASSQAFDFLPIQFLVQDYDNYEYETTNIAGTFEWAPNSDVKFYFDAIINDQERLQESTRIQASGVSDLRNVQAPSTFETVNFGSLNGQNIGSIQAALTGVIPVESGDADPNLRMSTDTSSRTSDSKIFRLGTEWQKDAWSGRVELSTSKNDTNTPKFDATLNFINPNVATNSSNENGTPFVYDLTGGSLAFGIAQGVYGSPTTEQLLNPANYVLRDVNQQKDIAENAEDAFRTDFSLDLDWQSIKSVDFGYRYNKTSSLQDQIRSNYGLRSLVDAPRASLFSSVLTTGPDNFGDADGRDLFVRDFLVIDPELVNSDPDGVTATINSGIAAHAAVTGSTRGPISNPSSVTNSFFDIEEKTHALYGQANFEHGIFRGNAGFRYIDTEVKSLGNTVINGVATPTTTTGSYDFFLPRINIVADVREDLLVRAGWSKDIRRPDFDNLSTSFSFDTSPNPAVELGNPSLEPEEVESFDISAEWYFAPSSVVSIGYFHKKRTGLFVTERESPIEDPVTGFRDITDPCEAGGLFNPIADINVFGPVNGVGVCVPTSQVINGEGETTQKGFELAFQYDLSEFEDQLGWASGFGFILNYTHQEHSGGDTFLSPSSRGATVFSALGANDVSLLAPLRDLSENAYNITVYYEKEKLSARMRYTWRDAYRLDNDDLGSTSNPPFGIPLVQDDRGQLNASISYDVNDKLNIGLEAINLTESDVDHYCVNEGGLRCFQGLTDRRVTIGATYRF